VSVQRRKFSPQFKAEAVMMEGRGPFQELVSIRSRLTSSNNSASRTRPAGPGGVSGSGCARRHGPPSSPTPVLVAYGLAIAPCTIPPCTTPRRAIADGSSSWRGATTL
jgi:hypothetical protein